MNLRAKWRLPKSNQKDCHLFYRNARWNFKTGFNLISCENLYPKYYIPAWSLHRLVEIMFKGDIEGFVGYNIHANSVNIMYEYAISNIEALIKMGTFNKDYLEEQKK